MFVFCLFCKNLMKRVDIKFRGGLLGNKVSPDEVRLSPDVWRVSPDKHKVAPDEEDHQRRKDRPDGEYFPLIEGISMECRYTLSFLF